MGFELFADGVSIRSAPGDRNRWLAVNADGSINVVTTGGTPTAATITETVTPVPGVSTTIAAANVNRLGGVVVNKGPDPAYLSWTTPVTVGSGSIILQPGGSYDLQPQGSVVPRGALYAITDTGETAELGVTEYE